MLCFSKATNNYDSYWKIRFFLMTAKTYIPFDVELLPARKLRTSSLSCLYENGSLRNIKKDNFEIIRMFYTAVRLDNWDTASHEIENEQIEQNENGFFITYTARYYLSTTLLYKADITIEGNDDVISFSMKGKGHINFMSNRIGICTLLPAKECKGRKVQISDVSEKINEYAFPFLINPSQPFYHLKGMEWSGKNANIKLEFEGDIFEAEDQRNWMDDTFKIYSRPLSLPFPFQVNEGEALNQKVTLKISSDENNQKEYIPKKKTVFSKKPIPSIGYASPDGIQELTEEEIYFFNQIPFNHYRIELHFTKSWKADLEKIFGNAEKLNTKLEIVAFFTENFTEETDELKIFVHSRSKLISSILLLHKNYKTTPVELQHYAYPLLKKAFPFISVGYGTDCYFAELNRNRPTTNEYDFLSFSINPQVHAFDTRSLVENLNSLEDMIETIHSFSDKPIYISPVTFKKRKNHEAKADKWNELLNDYDSRQHTCFGSSWFLLCLYHLRKVEKITFFKTLGDSGIIASDHQITPIYKTLMQLKSFNPDKISKIITDSKIEIVFGNEKSEELIFTLSPKFVA